MPVSLAAPKKSSAKKEKSSTKSAPLDLKPLVTSYYSASNTKPAKMIRKNIFTSNLKHWVNADIDYGIVNPAYNFDTFTEYQILDHDLKPATRDKNLYCVTFSADDDKHGFMVLKYDEASSSLERMGAVETSYLYDLQANVTDIESKLAKTDIHVSTTTAARVKLVDTKRNRADEIILFSDDQDHHYAYYFGDKSLKKIK